MYQTRVLSVTPVAPVDRQHPVSLKVTERAVVGEHVESIARALEGAARTMTPVRPLARVRPQDLGAASRRHRARDLQEVPVRKSRR